MQSLRFRAMASNSASPKASNRRAAQFTVRALSSSFVAELFAVTSTRLRRTALRNYSLTQIIFYASNRNNNTGFQPVRPADILSAVFVFQLCATPLAAQTLIL